MSGSPELSSEVPGAGADADRAVAPRMGGDRGALGRGGLALVARATGISTSTIARGLSELRSRARLPPGRVRRPGGGRKRTIDKDPTLLRDLEGLVEPTTSGAPNAPLRWTAKSTRH